MIDLSHVVITRDLFAVSETFIASEQFPDLYVAWQQIAIAIVLAFISYALAPTPPVPTPPAVKDLDGPTADAGRPIPVVFGEISISGLNVIGYWDKETAKYMVAG